MKLPDFILDFFWFVGRLFSKKVADPPKQVIEAPDYHAPIAESPVPAAAHREPTFAERIAFYMATKGYHLDTNPKNGNIVYVSGMTADFGQNEDRPDWWNDLRLILAFDEKGAPYIAFSQIASTAPGWISTTSDKAKLRGGVAHVCPGQYQAWIMGYHKGNKNHPALVQAADIKIWRDTNSDFSQFEEPEIWGRFGINQHSTKVGYTGERVGKWSEGCLVGWNFEAHLEFIRMIKNWDSVKNDPDHILHTTVIDAKELFA